MQTGLDMIMALDASVSVGPRCLGAASQLLC